jgi:hypothetical protein
MEIATTAARIALVIPSFPDRVRTREGRPDPATHHHLFGEVTLAGGEL